MNENCPLKKQISLIEGGLKLRLVHSINNFLRKHTFKGSSRMMNLLIKLLIPTPKGHTIVHTCYDFDIIIDDPVIDNTIQNSIYYCGTYEAGTLNILERCLRSGDTFFDIGSNIGLMSLFASGVIGEKGTVHTFEPEPIIFAKLQKNIEINKVSNIRPYNFALGSNRSTLILYRVDRENASLIKPQENSCEGAEVFIQTLDEFISENTISNIRMIKIDVEGWELEVLKGGNHLFSRPDAPIICIEYSNLHPLVNGKLVDVYNYILHINDYEIYKLKKGKEYLSKLVRIVGVPDLPYHDNLFCFLPSHLKALQKNIFV